MRARRPQPWYQNIPLRLRFERETQRLFSGLTSTCTGRGYGAAVIYRARLDIPYYETREVRITLRNLPRPVFEHVRVDGPTDSPHRYSATELCLWYPRDPVTLRWVPDDGLVVLLAISQEHLFKEAYWRETRRWPGREAPHAPGEASS